MKFRNILILTAASLIGCTSTSQDDADAVASALVGVAEGSAEASAILAVANTASLSQLSEVSGARLGAEVAGRIIAARSYHSLAQLDAVEGVSAATFRQMLDYARSIGGSKTCTVEPWVRPASGRIEGVVTAPSCTVDLKGIVFAEGSKLIVRAGATLTPDGDITGDIELLGTEERPITITAPLALSGKNASRISFIDTVSGINVAGSKTVVEIDNSTISYPEHNAVRVQGGFVSIRKSILANSATGLRVDYDKQKSPVVGVEDSVIKRNRIGVQLEGLNQEVSCPVVAPPPPPPATIPRQPLDPVLLHVDITENERGIQVTGSDLLLRLESSNLTRNGYGAIFYAKSVDPRTTIRNSNVYANGEAPTGWQISSFLSASNIDLSDNFWLHTPQDFLQRGNVTSMAVSCGPVPLFGTPRSAPVADAGPRGHLRLAVADATVAESAFCPRYWRDADGDGYGTPQGLPVALCAKANGYVANNLDLDDANALLFPGSR
jgi:hypothetical protein